MLPVVDTTSSQVCVSNLLYNELFAFKGKDATRAFVTGDFSENGLVDTVDGLSEQELLSVLDWVKFYEKDYKLVGVVEGSYYDEQGNPTDLLTEVGG